MSPEAARALRRGWFGVAAVVAVLLGAGIVIGTAVGWALSELVLTMMHTIVVDQG